MQSILSGHNIENEKAKKKIIIIIINKRKKEKKEKKRKGKKIRKLCKPEIRGVPVHDIINVGCISIRKTYQFH